MQTELMYRKPMITTRGMSTLNHNMSVHRLKRDSKDSRETIHSGHFMVSDFEAEAQDDEDELAVPVPEEEAVRNTIIAPVGLALGKSIANSLMDKTSQQLSIETSLNKLFQCMSLAYRQKLTSPKWNRFKGIRLRWKDKIRLNNVIWRCWHMQFILKQNTLVCQFASPLDVDTHNKPEAVVLEGKYWKRKLAAVTAEYKKWRMFYRNKILGWTNKDGMLESMDMLDWDTGVMNSSSCFPGSMMNSHGNASGMQGPDSMMVDEDYMELMTDTLFSTISSNQPIYFPDPREIARGASLADFIQPSLGPLQPNLDDFMDTLEPLQEFLNSKLPPVPEEEDIFRSGTLNSNYSDLDLMASMNQVNQLSEASNDVSVQQQSLRQDQNDMQALQYTAKIYTQPQDSYRNNMIDTYTPRQSYENQIKEKTPRGRSVNRNRVIQQPQAFNQNPQVIYQPQSRGYNSDLQPLHLNTSNQVPMNLNSNQMTIDNVNLVTNFSLSQDSQPQQRVLRPLPQMSDPFKLVPQQNYKLPTATSLPSSSSSSSSSSSTSTSSLSSSQSYNQYKYKLNNTKVAQPVTVTVSSSNPSQSHILLQCKPSGLDLSTSIQQTKIVPRPSSSTSSVNTEKEDIFAVPKYQMKARSRSRSSSALSVTRNHPAPLVSAVSDPALNLNNNVLLAHLLTNNTTGLYTVTSGPEKIITTVANQQTMSSNSGIKNILPVNMLPSNAGQVGSTSVSHLTNHVGVGGVQTLSSNPGQSTIQRVNSTVMLTNQSPSPSHQQVQVPSHQQNSPGSPNDSSAHSPQALSISPLHSPMSIGSPLSPSRIYVKGESSERGTYKESRRVGHIHAEQKRRYNIKTGFDTLHSLIPQLNQNPNAKLSKAAMLQKGAEYIRQLRTERNQLKEEMDNLRKEIDALNTSISNSQSQLPATGAPVSRQRTNKMREMYDDYVRKRTQENWKFWIFSKLLEPLLISFNGSVSTSSISDLCRSTVMWADQYCALVDLRPAVLNSLRYLCTATDILSDPERLPEEALAAVNRTDKQKSTQ
ncbi:MLX-interacting protein [Microplitis demolitor]|uniref:MLX-interacting protein n=1 Tax=Microplitis demolitor TaxID=69319 RepID=UPI0004CD0ADE|nr:MLX-interacting protein [Microplitis demolitor]XP_053592946.1 MLX-interacting protein [Microplitis demolitor]